MTIFYVTVALTALVAGYFIWRHVRRRQELERLRGVSTGPAKHAFNA